MAGEDGARRTASSGSPFEAAIGFSRAVRLGAHVAVSGSAPIAADGTTHAPGDAYAQMVRCIEIVRTALGRVGARLEDVVRTRMLLVRREDWPAVARAHGELFGDIRPAATMIVVAGLLEPGWLVELEADAIVAEPPPGAR